MSNHSEKQQISTLTGLRGFAVVLVFISHLGDTGLMPSWLGEGMGKFGVMLFFILSGYLMTTLYYETPFQSTWRRYAFARIGRVIPLYYLLVVISIFATGNVDGWRYQIPTKEDAAMHFLCTYGYGEMWAVPVEIQFYVFFMMTWFFSQKFALRRNSKRLLLALFSAVVISVGLTYFQKKYWEYWTSLNLVLVYFLIGFFLSLYQAEAKKLIDGLRATFGDTALFIVSVIGFVMCVPALRRTVGLYLPLWFDPTIMVAMTLMFLLSLYAVGPYRLLNLSLFQFLGQISYGFYLIHPLVLYLAILHWSELPAWQLVTIITVVTTILSYVSFHYFEAPMGKRIRRLENFGLRPKVEDRPASAPQS